MAPSNAPFFNSANQADGTQSGIFFEAKYYGPCPEISTLDDAPVIDNVVELMTRRKSIGDVVRCNLQFTETGATVVRRKSKGEVVTEWSAANMASCATAPLPNSKTRRVGLLKIRSATTGEMVWHMFKYYSAAKVDNMTNCFQFVVDCTLRDIGRALATQIAQGETPQFMQQTASAWTPPPAFDETSPPSYDEANTEAELEAADLRRSSCQSNVCYDDSDGSPDVGYMLVAPVY